MYYGCPTFRSDADINILKIVGKTLALDGDQIGRAAQLNEPDITREYIDAFRDRQHEENRREGDRAADDAPANLRAVNAEHVCFQFAC